jgi:hypothetical protein
VAAGIVTVRFIKSSPGARVMDMHVAAFSADERAGFPPAVAAELQRAGFAEGALSHRPGCDGSVGTGRVSGRAFRRAGVKKRRRVHASSVTTRIPMRSAVWAECDRSACTEPI